MMAILLQKFRFLFLFIFFSLPIFFFCGGQLKLQEGQEKLVTKEKKPDWLFQVGKDFVVGYSGRFESEKEARANALWDARKKIIEQLGMKLTIAQQENLLERTSQLDDEIVATHVESEIKTEAISRGLISVKAKEYYVEKYAKKYFGEIKYYYLAFVLVPFSKEEHDNLIKNTFDQLQNRFTEEFGKITSLRSELKSLIIHFDFLDQLTENAKELIGLKPDLVSIVDGWIADIKKEKSLLKENIHIELIGEEHEIGNERRLAENIGVKVSYQNSPIPNVNIELLKKDKIVTQGITDEKGEYLFKYQKPIIGNLELSVRVSLGENFLIQGAAFHFSNPLKIAVCIPELDAEKKRNKRIVANAVIENLLQNGVMVDQSLSLDQADVLNLLTGSLDVLSDKLQGAKGLLLVGRSYVQNVSNLPLNPELFQAESACELKLIDPVNGSTVWNVALTQEFVMGNGRLDAGNRSLQKLSYKVTEKIKEFLFE